MSDNKVSVLDALLYSSVFHFPLSISEICRYSSEKGLTTRRAKQDLAALYPSVKQRDGYYFIDGEEGSVAARKRGQKHAAQQYRDAVRIAYLWRFVPTVLYVGLSGSSAHGSSRLTDDIDFFIITRRKTIFITRFILLMSLTLLGMRSGSKKGRFCLNMFLDEDHMRFQPERQELYTAREIVQLVSLLDVDMTYYAFRTVNSWTGTLLPNASDSRAAIQRTSFRFERFLVQLLRFFRFESITESMQRFRLRKQHRLIVSDAGFLGLYSHANKSTIVRKYQQKIRKFEAVLRSKHRTTVRRPVHIDKEKNIFYTA